MMYSKTVLAVVDYVHTCCRSTAKLAASFSVCFKKRHFHASLGRCLHTVMGCALSHCLLRTNSLSLDRVTSIGRGRYQVWGSSGIQFYCSFSDSQVNRRYDPAGWKNKDSVPDLQRFLSEIGTDPKEGRFWLKQFQKVNKKKPFAVLEVHSEVFTNASRGSQMIQVNPDLIQWCMTRQVIPIIPSFGETSLGCMIQLTLWEVTSSVAKQLQPFKVIMVNCHGGFKDEYGQRKEMVHRACHADESALPSGSNQDSLVMSVSESLCVIGDRIVQQVKEDDTESGNARNSRGQGYKRSFKKRLLETYFDDIRNQIHTIFVSECYTAAAVILHVEGCEVPYLCKIAVSAQAQGEGTGEILWNVIRRDFPQLFWRSRNNNIVNHWYFKKSEGMWIVNSIWTVFWYGIPEPGNSLELIQSAVSAPESFH